MEVPEQVFLVFVQEKTKDGRQNTNQRNQVIPKLAFCKNGKRKKPEQWPIGIRRYLKNDANHTVTGNPFVYQNKNEKDKNKNQVNTLTDFFSFGFVYGVIPVNAQYIDTE
jgi:hypothetical protein